MLRWRKLPKIYLVLHEVLDSIMLALQGSWGLHEILSTVARTSMPKAANMAMLSRPPQQKDIKRLFNYSWIREQISRAGWRIWECSTGSVSRRPSRNC